MNPQAQQDPRFAQGKAQMRRNAMPASMLTPQAESIIARLNHVLEQETAALRAGGQAELKEFTERKSRLLLELRHVADSLDLKPGDPMPAPLDKLRMRLQENQELLNLHMRAVREISDIVADTIQNNDSDGTYSMKICGMGRD